MPVFSYDGQAMEGVFLNMNEKRCFRMQDYRQ